MKSTFGDSWLSNQVNMNATWFFNTKVKDLW